MKLGKAVVTLYGESLMLSYGFVPVLFGSPGGLIIILLTLQAFQFSFAFSSRSFL